jgi:hypothetical protein
MKQAFKIIVVLIAVGGLCLSCHKYPEDPFISFVKPSDRLSGTKDGYTWKFTSYKINGVEHSHDFDNILSPRTLTNITLTFFPNPKGEELIFTINDLNIPGNNWGINKTTNTIGFSINTNHAGPTDSTAYKFSPILGYYQTSLVEWKIDELYESTFHISNNGIDIYFEKQ